MTSAPTSHEVICPHCKKQFRGELLGAAEDPQRGFKCPHCRLFIPFERAAGQDLVEPAETS
jgi:DNA-directed RNA polymerase subunit RPC12/RpoP